MSISVDLLHGVMTTGLDCGQWTADCSVCASKKGCGFCANELGSCVNGFWQGPLDTNDCPTQAYFYDQCQLSTRSLEIGIFVAFVLAILLIVFLCVCCRRRRYNDETEEEERQSLLPSGTFGTKYLRRSATYYQWNRPPPPPPTKARFTKALQNQKLPTQSPPLSLNGPSQPQNANWEDRRLALLKKYARGSSTGTTR
ncbi:hypothetical protein J3Q64DRAFT_1875448 [Phycomyces blakesleeanus]|uniref:PSI domain-containing protein n=2 Tax=Phycomyces blakesleeanus TaxID=4837 RepID=A0A163EQC0_PHYB8|nr:hypothetical protein PHYBLDRAFT_138371 [Phycomyces blakesleeanus NRRL 1555(-)]OAD80820.1 hypothetical protein PHYBLDRAFT_138371 [Phycomyces blakesleeanus NRRL 1555(-)]|eukprot:XP_018298860.1 hypothetical protein PHYBLDRAFT_138371 [Phycomyces blakesleeanus NRRL 1555(-)]